MIKISIIVSVLLLTTSLLQGALTVDDNQYIRAYNKESSLLNRNYSSLRTIKDYKDAAKRAKVESNFQNLKKIIKSFSDQKDSQVVRMQKNYKSMVTTYNKNLKTAGVSQKNSTKASPKNAKKSLHTLIDDYNRIYNKSFKDYNNMRTDADMKNPTKQVALNKDYKELTATLNAIKPLDQKAYSRAKRGYDDWVGAYKSKARHFTGANAVASTSSANTKEMTSQDRRNLKKFRSLYIENDYYFRNVDTVKLQDPEYRKPLEAKLKQLQALLNPMRHKTFDRGVKRADSDLKKIEDIFASASTQSKKMASSVSNIDEEFKAIKSAFDKEKFDPRLQRDYISGEARSPQDVKVWATTLKEYKKLIPDMTKFLDKVRNNTVEGRKQPFRTYRHWFVNNVESDIDEAVLDSTRRWNTEMFNGIVKYRTYSKANFDRRFKNQRSVKEMMDEFNVGMKALTNQKVYEQATFGSYTTKTQKYITDYKRYDKELSKAKEMSLKNQKMPQAVERNSKLIALAESMIKSDLKKNASHLRIVRKFMHNKVLEYSQGWYVHAWDSFIVAFVEKHGNKYLIQRAFLSKEISNKYSPADGGKWHINLEGESIEIPKQNIR